MHRFNRDERGATTVEYILLVVSFMVVFVAISLPLRSAARTQFANQADNLNAACQVIPSPCFLGNGKVTPITEAP